MTTNESEERNNTITSAKSNADKQIERISTWKHCVKIWYILRHIIFPLNVP